MVWKPHVTIIAIVEKQQHFLLVEELVDTGLAFSPVRGEMFVAPKNKLFFSHVAVKCL